MTQVTAIVPVRHNSERVPGKNRRLFFGVPLFERIIRVLERCETVSAIAVDTDSDEVAGVLARAYPDVRVIRRPAELLGGDMSVNRILAHDLAELGGDWFLQTHCTNPLLLPGTIDRAVRDLEQADGYDSAFGVTRVQTRLYDAGGAAVNHDPAELLRTQDLPPLFEENSNLYLFSRESFAATGRRIGERPQMIEIDRVEAIDIDDEASWTLAEAAFRATQLDIENEVAA